MGKLNTFKDQYSIGSFFSTNFKISFKLLYFFIQGILFLFLVQMNVLMTQKISFRNTLTESL